ncbi:MAG: phosphoesterase [Frankiales bacterium]|nr:phosphoesterase [Frankiales bacterium]
MRTPLAVLSGLVLAAGLLLAPQATAAKPGLEGVPHFDHVVVLTEENEAAATTFAADSPAKYLKSLRSKGVFLANYYGTGHASLDNYIAMVSGQPPQPATMSDCLALSLWSCVQPQGLQSGGRNLADQLEDAKLSWRSYQDGTATPCFHAKYAAGDVAPDPYQGNSTTGAKNYADRHNPFLYFPDVIGDQARCNAHQRPFTDLARDLAHGALPAFSFITPDTCNDGHDNPCAGQKVGGLTTVDSFLKANLPALLRYLAAHNGLLVINFDEGGTPSSPQDAVANSAEYSCPSCAGLGIGGRTGAILVSPRLRQGLTVTTGYDHYSLLRTLEDSFGIGEHLGEAGRATAMSEAFRGSR